MNLPSNRAPRLGALRDVDSLLAAAGAESVHELGEQVHQNQDVDMQVERTERGHPDLDTGWGWARTCRHRRASNAPDRKRANYRRGFTPALENLWVPHAARELS